MPHPGLLSLLVRSTPNTFFLRPWPAAGTSHGIVIGFFTISDSGFRVFIVS
jgi:hypothetical protein